MKDKLSCNPVHPFRLSQFRCYLPSSPFPISPSRLTWVRAFVYCGLLNSPGGLFGLSLVLWVEKFRLFTIRPCRAGLEKVRDAMRVWKGLSRGRWDEARRRKRGIDVEKGAVDFNFQGRLLMGISSFKKSSSIYSTPPKFKDVRSDLSVLEIRQCLSLTLTRTKTGRLLVSFDYKWITWNKVHFLKSRDWSIRQNLGFRYKLSRFMSPSLTLLGFMFVKLRLELYPWYMLWRGQSREHFEFL